MVTQQIALSSGLWTIVNDEDASRVLAAGPWHSTPPRHGRIYAQRGVRRPDGGRTTQKLHHFLTGWSYVDHRNGDGLDNRRTNLRQSTGSQNNANSRLSRRNTSGYKGVSWFRRKRKWRAAIRANGRTRYLGYFAAAEDAARAYDAAALEIFGEFARPNFPMENAS